MMAEAPSSGERGWRMTNGRHRDQTERGRRMETAIWRQLRSKIECIAKGEEEEESNQYMHGHGIDMRVILLQLASDAFYVALHFICPVGGCSHTQFKSGNVPRDNGSPARRRGNHWHHWRRKNGRKVGDKKIFYLPKHRVSLSRRTARGFGP